jgi:uncharacterized UBP type Zn finger protein
MEKKICSHILSVKEVISPAERVCDECVKSDGRWVHLRTCQTCGTTLCCDSSPHKHATAHFQSTGHPVVISVIASVIIQRGVSDLHDTPLCNVSVIFSFGKFHLA